MRRSLKVFIRHRSRTFEFIRLTSVLVVFLFINAASAQNIDTTFIPRVLANPTITASALQPDGKMVVAGDLVISGNRRVFGLVRINTDGSHDDTFAPPVMGEDQNIFDIAIQPDGKILISGGFTTGTHAGIARLHSDGSLDDTFNYDSGSGQVSSMLLLADGKTMILGSGTSPVKRLNSDGSIDNGFNTGNGPDGYGLTDFFLQQDDGKVLYFGSFNSFSGTNAHGIIRLNDDGSIDPTFNVGTGTTDILSFNSASILSDQKILVGGSFEIFDGYNFPKLVRLDQDGFVDVTFAPPAELQEGLGIPSIVQKGDSLLLMKAYYDNIELTTQYKVYKMSIDGQLDTDFDVVIKGNRQSDYDPLPSILLGSQGWVAAGSFHEINGTPRTGLASISYDGVVDPGFAPFLAGPSIINDVLRLDDGQILIAGEFDFINQTRVPGLALLSATGSLNESFGDNLGTGFEDFRPRILRLQNDGRILIGGPFWSFNGSAANGILRLNADGTRDMTFSSGLQLAHLGEGTKAIQVLPSGKTIVGGLFAGSGRYGLARLNTDGSLDDTFDAGTFTNTKFVTAIGLQSSGNLILAGNADYNSDGILQITNGDGVLIRDLTGLSDITNQSFHRILVLPNDRFLCGGDFSMLFDTQTRNRVIAYDANGDLLDDHSVYVKNMSINDIATIQGDTILVVGNYELLNYQFIANLGEVTLGGSITSGVDLLVKGEIKRAARVRSDRNVFLVAGNIPSIAEVDYYGLAKIDLDAPVPPRNLLNQTATGEGYPKLIWQDQASNETGYSIWRSVNNGPFIAIDSVGTNNSSYTDSATDPGEIYSYFVAAYDIESISRPSNTISVSTDLPETPGNLSYQFNSPSQVTLQWTDNSENELAFVIERSVNNSLFEVWQTTQANVTQMADSTITFGDTFSYRIRGVNFFGYSDYSNTLTLPVITVSDIPSPPGDLSAFADTDNGTIKLDWKDQSSNETGFSIWRGGENGSFMAIDSVGTNITSYSDSKVDPMETYKYLVASFDDVLVSFSPDTVSVNTDNFIPPEAPDGLAYEFLSASVVKLSWRDNSENEQEFAIERSDPHSAFAAWKTVASNITQAIDSSITENDVFTYRVRAHNFFGYSPYSETIGLPVITGVNTTELHTSSIYPNPVKDVLHVTANTSPIQNLRIQTIQGETVIFLSSVESEIAINMSSFTSGIYILVYTQDRRLIRSRIIKQ